MHDVTDYGEGDGETNLVRCKPQGIDELVRVTNFTRKELQTMYRGFKQVLSDAPHFLYTAHFTTRR